MRSGPHPARALRREKGRQAVVSSRGEVAALDAADRLAPLRVAFDLPEGVRYFGGHSLGPLPRAARERVQGTLAGWGGEAVGAWNSAGWVDRPQRVGETIGRLIGAAAGEVLVAGFDLRESVPVAAGRLPAADGPGRDPDGYVELSHGRIYRGECGSGDGRAIGAGGGRRR